MSNSAPLSLPRPTRRPAPTLLALIALVLLGGTFLGQARASDDEVRVDGTCGRNATSQLRLEADDGSIRVRFRVDSNRSHARWRLAVVHEGSVAWRTRVRSDGGGSIHIRRRLRDLPGADQVTARALGPHGITCIAAGTLPG
jgi:hypothetical protein